MSRTSPLFLVTLDTLAFLVLSDSLFQSRKRKNLLLCYTSDYIYATNWRWSLLWLISNYSHILLLINYGRRTLINCVAFLSHVFFYCCLYLLFPLGSLWWKKGTTVFLSSLSCEEIQFTPSGHSVGDHFSCLLSKGFCSWGEALSIMYTLVLWLLNWSPNSIS